MIKIKPENVKTIAPIVLSTIQITIKMTPMKPVFLSLVAIVINYNDQAILRLSTFSFFSTMNNASSS